MFILTIDIPFVEWVNAAGMTVEAVFCGHTHLSGGYMNITVNNMNLDNFNLDTNKLLYAGDIYYLETDTACKEYP